VVGSRSIAGAQMQRLYVGLASLLTVAVTAGCGGSSSGGAAGNRAASPTAATLSAGQYRVSLTAIAKQESQAQQVVGSALHAKTVAKISASLTAFAADQGQVADELSRLHPPADAVAANAALARAFKANAAATRRVADRVAHTKTTRQAFRIIQHAKAAQATGKAIDVALSELRKLGYTKGS
jgi:hypothetical protein